MTWSTNRDPTSVQVNGQTLASSAWSYNSSASTLQVPLGAVATGSSATVTQIGGTPVQLAEPTTALITFTSPATAAAGQQVTVTGSGFGAAQGSSYLTFSDNGTNWGAPPIWPASPSTAGAIAPSRSPSRSPAARTGSGR